MTRQLGQAKRPYPDNYAVCYDYTIPNRGTIPRIADMIRHIKTNCAQFTVTITDINGPRIFEGANGLCIFDEYIDIKLLGFNNMTIDIESAEDIEFILCGYIYELNKYRILQLGAERCGAMRNNEKR